MKPHFQFNFQGMNTILYCQKFKPTLKFYHDVLHLKINFETEWLVEFEIMNNGYLSIADASRTTILPANGDGVTLTIQVENLDDA